MLCKSPLSPCPFTSRMLHASPATQPAVSSPSPWQPRGHAFALRLLTSTRLFHNTQTHTNLQVFRATETPVLKKQVLTTLIVDALARQEGESTSV